MLRLPFLYPKFNMKNLSILWIFVVFFAVTAFSQKTDVKQPEKIVVNSAAADAAALDLARSVFAAHGGEKLHGLKTLVVRGAVDLTSAAFNQAIPGAFSMVLSGDKYRVEMANQIQSFKQTFDGENTWTSVQTGFTLPPISRLGLPLLARLGDAGFIVSQLPANSKKRIGFRITAPDGYFTDFFIDEKTKQVKGYESAYEYAGRMFTTSVEIDRYRTVDGIVVPEKYAQRFDLGQLIVYGDFRAKEVLINSEIANDVFIGK